MSANNVQQQRKKNPPRLPDHGPWPPIGFVSPEKVMAALGGCCLNTVLNRVRAGALPKPILISPNKLGFPVEETKRAISALMQSGGVGFKRPRGAKSRREAV